MQVSHMVVAAAHAAHDVHTCHTRMSAGLTGVEEGAVKKAYAYLMRHALINLSVRPGKRF